MSFRNGIRFTVMSAALTLLALSANAQQSVLPQLPEGHTLINLSVTERINVVQDEIVADLRVEVEDRDASVVQNAINEQMREGLIVARAVTGVDAATGHYSVYQINRQPQGGRADPVWRGSQSITLESKDPQTLLSLAGELQDMGFVMSQLSYRLSTERADEVRDSLMETAIARARANAERAAAALGRPEVEIASLTIETGMSYAAPVMMRAMDTGSREMATPSAEAGESEVSLTVNVQAVAR